MSALPHNLEAEQALLGALLFDNRTMERLPPLTPGMFFDPVHGRIFKALADLIRGGRLADGLTVRDRFASDGGLQEIGGASYLLTLMEAAAKLPIHATEYANEILDLYQRREAITAAQTIIDEMMRNREDAAADIIRRGEKGLQGLSVGGQNWISARAGAAAIQAGLDNPAPPGARTGISKLDRLIGGGLFAPDFVVIAGRPSMGKTALADNISTNVADAGLVVGSFSMEMSAEQIAARIIARRSAALGPSIKVEDFRRGEARPKAKAIAHLVERVPETLLIDETGAQSLAGIEASARNMRRAMGQLDLILVDYLQLMRESGTKRESRVNEVSEITAGLKALAKRLGVPVVALSQLSRAVENRADKRPQLSDLRESGSIEQDADVVLFVYREHYYLERSPPTPIEDESRADFSARKAAYETRLFETENIFDIFTGKNRNGPTGAETLFCNLAMDVIADEMPERTPHAHKPVQDGVS